MEDERAGMTDQPIVVRDNDYYGGDITVTGMLTHRGNLVRVTIRWEAYEGGHVEIVLQDIGELERLGRALLSAADTAKPKDWVHAD